MVSFPQVSPLKLCMHVSSPPYVLHALPICLLNLIMIFGEEYRSQSSLLCSLLNSPITSSILSPNILLSTLFLKTLSLHSSLSVSNQVSQPYKTTGKIIQGAAEIVKHVKILFTCFSGSVSWNAGV